MFSRLLAGPAVPADQRSVLPTVRGVPWWGAVLIAVGITTIGAVIDAESASTLGRSFKLCYLVGCILAALLVRQRALFTAAAQPPLVAFAVGIATLFVLDSGDSQGLRAIVFKVVLPIASSFPWILLAFLATLTVVLVRWFAARPSGQPFFGKGSKRPAGVAKKATPAKKTPTKTATTAKKPAAKTGSPTQGAPTKAKRPATSRPTSTTDATPAKPTVRRRPESEPAPRRAAPRKSAPRPAAAQPAQPRSAQASATAAGTPPRRRAAPQTIPARDTKGARRTAGQMRDKAHIEDLTAGADDR
ncbi:DUF6542 domain-containing protein [Gordonia sp. (in: high G+C Gram-positive bacteria)]|uniref:DUF6542 domain-containing protein n=1 Tax=Gordonia sp. (in: high G+C Gram-positive bacteria) TaxID=84139 RepID=UPI003C7870B7